MMYTPWLGSLYTFVRNNFTNYFWWVHEATSRVLPLVLVLYADED